MQSTPLKRNSTLRSYTPLKRGTSQLKRSRIRVAPITPRKELDAIVSKVVRLSHADSMGMVKCATCPKILHWTKIQCGHFQRRGNTATRYKIINLAPQCEDCNCYKNGKEEEFTIYIDENFGPGTADKLREEAQTICRYYPYEEEIIKWDAALQTLLDKDSGIQY